MYAFSAALVNNNAQDTSIVLVRSFGGHRRYSVALLSVAIVQHRDDGAAPLVFTNPVKRLPEDSLVNQRIVVSILALGLPGLIWNTLCVPVRTGETDEDLWLKKPDSSAVVPVRSGAMWDDTHRANVELDDSLCGLTTTSRSRARAREPSLVKAARTCAKAACYAEYRFQIPNCEGCRDQRSEADTKHRNQRAHRFW